MTAALPRSYLAFLLVVCNCCLWLTLLGSHPDVIAEEAEVPSAVERDTGGKILCFVLTEPSNEHKSLAVRETWGARCDEILFFSSIKLSTIPSVTLDVVDDYAKLWAKTRSALTYIHQHYGDKYDWFLKADDDTYVVLENLRGFLEKKNSSQPVWYGCRLRNKKIRQGYMSGGAGYVLSRQAVHRVVEQAFTGSKKQCSVLNYGYEDLELGRCLESVGVQAGDTRDENSLPRFFPFSPEHLTSGHARTNTNHWYWNTVWWKHKLGKDCCSPKTVTFHQVDPSQMYAIDFLLYKLKIQRS